jgi:phosphoribosylformylglycinamidine synthase
MVAGEPPAVSLDRERALLQVLARAAGRGLLQSAHDCSDGGIAVTICESAFDSGGIGCEVDLAAAGLETAGFDAVLAALFSESAARAVVSVRQEDRAELIQVASAAGVPARVIGRTGGERITIAVDGRAAVECPVAEAEQIWATALGRHFARG